MAEKLAPEKRHSFVHGGQNVFEWDQTLEEVNVYIPLPPGIPTQLLYCKIQSNHVEVGIKGNPPYLNHDLASPVKTDSSFWTIVDGTMHVTLQKRDKGHTWPSPIKEQGILDPYSADLEQKRLMLQRFQEEMPKRKQSIMKKKKRRRVGQTSQVEAFTSQSQTAHTTMECCRKAIGRNTIIYLKKIAELFKSRNLISRLKESCFGFLFDWKVKDRVSMSSNLLTYMVEHHTKSLEFKFGEREVLFTPKEFSLIMGLTYASSPPSIHEPVSCRLKEQYFPHGAITQPSLWGLLESWKIHKDEDAIKLALVLLLESVILGANSTMTVPVKYLCLVDELHKFEKYPWGNVAYEHLCQGMDAASKVHKRGRGEKTSKYNVYGCTYALQAWALERCPKFAERAASKEPTAKWPRLLNWFEAKHISWMFLVEHENSEFTFSEELTPTDAENEKYCMKYFSGYRMEEEGGDGEEMTPFALPPVPEPTTRTAAVCLETLVQKVALLEAEMNDVKAELKEIKTENKQLQAEVKDAKERLCILEVDNEKLSAINDDKPYEGENKEEEGGGEIRRGR